MGTERAPDDGWIWLMKSKAGGNETANRLYEKVNGLQISELLNRMNICLGSSLIQKKEQGI